MKQLIRNIIALISGIIIGSIINMVSGLPAPIMTPEIEEKLIIKFKEIQMPFEQHCPPERKNFLSYSYTLHKLCDLIGEKSFISYFPLLKSREKLYNQDKIWEGICKDLGWKFKKSL